MSLRQFGHNLLFSRFTEMGTKTRMRVAARYNIRGIPTLMLFKNGAVAAQRAGAMDANTLRTWLR